MKFKPMMETNVSYISKKFKYGEQEVLLETGKIARQATASVLVTIEDTSVLVAVVGRKMRNRDKIFSVNCELRGKTYAAGKIPGGFFRERGGPQKNSYI